MCAVFSEFAARLYESVVVCEFLSCYQQSLSLTCNPACNSRCIFKC